MSFLKAFFASLVGFLVGVILLFLVVLGIVGGIVASASKKEVVQVNSNSVLTLDLSRAISERTSDDPFKNLNLGEDDKNTLGLTDVVKAITAAKTDSKIKGIYIASPTGVMLGPGLATAQAIRNALLDFKTSGKFIYAYSVDYTEKTYYLASVADSIFLYKNGLMEWNGFAATPYFLRGMFDKLEIEPIVFRVGKYKSFGETYTEKKMSDAARLETKEYVTDIWGQMLDGIAKSRKTNVEALNKLADDLSVLTASEALHVGLIDGLRFEDQVQASLKQKLNVDAKKDISTISVAEYAKSVSSDTKLKANKIAVLYATGEINVGEGDDNTIGSTTMVNAIRKLRKDESVKAIVLRVNSGGGSALASDLIWRELTLAKAAKPVIASFGDVAASGGYYIAAGADRIVAQPNTITGSIGVIGIWFDVDKFFTNKLGITFDRVNTNTHADLGSPRPLDALEKKRIQDGVNETYGDFIHVVQAGRGYKDSATVDNLAQGRVYTGKRALELKLVDELGGLDDAIKIAAKKAALGDDYRVVDYPNYKTTFEKILSGLQSRVQVLFWGKGLSSEAVRLQKMVDRASRATGVYMESGADYDIH